MTKVLYAKEHHAFPNPSFQLCGSSMTKGFPVVRDTTTRNYVKLAGANARIIWISKEDVSAAWLPVAITSRPCYAVVKITDTIVDGDTLKTANDGSFVKASSATTDIVCAIAQEPWATGDYIEVLLVQPYVL